METIKFRHAISTSILFTLGGVIISLGNNNYYLWQTLLISFLSSIIFILLYQGLLNKYPNKNLFEIIKLKYDNIFGNIIITLYLFILLYNAINVIYIFTDFITTTNQSDFISKELIMLINLVLLGYVLKNSLSNIMRISQSIFIIVITMIIALFFIGIQDMNYTNLFPIKFTMNNNVNIILELITRPFLEITILYNIFSKLENNKYKKYSFLINNLLSFLILILIIIETVCILGNDYTKYLNYPYYSAISCIDISKIVIKIESLSIIIFYFSCFIRLVLIMNCLILGFNTITNTKKKYYYPFLLLVHILSLVIYDNIYELNKLKYSYSVIFIIITCLIPILINIKNNNNQMKNIMHNT